MAKKLKCDQPAKLMLKTQRLLKQSKVELTEICLATGIPYHWLTNFLNDVSGNPGVNRVERLYEFLSHNELIV